MSSKYPPAFVDQVRTWYLKEGKSDTDIAKLAPLPPHRVHLTRNAVIGLRQRANPPIVREGDRDPARRAFYGTSSVRKERETKPAPEPQRQAPEPVRTPAPPPVQTPGTKPYRIAEAGRVYPQPEARPIRASPLALRIGPTLVELEPHQCRNPVGPEPSRPAEQMFCGLPKGRRTVEVGKGEFREVADVYCSSCASRNRVGTSSASSLIRANRMFG